jgi:16S rRNA (guanine1207-N2)-methyltransferase
MDNAVSTLFYPLEQGLFPLPAASFIAFLNARRHAFLMGMKGAFLQQYFKPYAQELRDGGYTAASDIKASPASFKAVFILLPKNALEADYMVAQGLSLLQEDGILVAAADNKAGGARLAKILQGFGLKNIQHASKNKARVAWAIKEDTDMQTVKEALAAGEMQKILEGDYVSMPGIFGWEKIDEGSEILAQHLPTTLKGTGADFGCGYGYLARHVLKNSPNVQSLSCIDADYRAIKACQENLKEFQTTKNIRYFWEDLRVPLANISDFDFIVMNPPFHEGKKIDVDIGVDFIANAAQSLRSGGMLWMVANAQLAYEPALAAHFKRVEKKYEGKGFKVFAAEK